MNHKYLGVSIGDNNYVFLLIATFPPDSDDTRVCRPEFNFIIRFYVLQITIESFDYINSIPIDKCTGITNHVHLS